MPGFGSGPFGSGPFGQYDWAKQVTFRDLPEIDRRLDAEVVPGQPLETFTDAIHPSFDELLRFAREFGSLRDADTVRTQFQGRLDVELLKAESAVDGRVIEALAENPDAADPFSPLETASIGWILKDRAGREFFVNAVHKLREEGPTLELEGVADLPTSALGEAVVLTGTVEFVEGSTTVTGVGTLFLSEVAPGQLVAPQGSLDFGRVDSITDDLNLELEEPYVGPSTGPATIAVVGTVSDGAAVLRPPGQIDLLGADFGIEVDQHEPESFQRSSVRNVHQWISRKGAQKAYDIVAKIAGYRAEAIGLWRVGDFEQLTGTAEFTFGSDTIIGTGTKFLTEVTPGQLVSPGAGIDSGTVLSIPNDFTLVLSAPYAGSSTGPGSPILAFDEPIPVGIPISALFEAPPGSGKLYTSLAPFRPFFDEIAADVVPLDFFCFEEPLWTTDAITPPDPSPPDGTSVEDAIGIDTQGLSIISTTPLGGGRHEIRVGPSAEVANVVGVGSWYADFPTIPGVRHFLETIPVEGPPGEWVFEILAGLSPAFGATVNLGYQCRPAASCDFCRASVLRVEVTPAEIFTEPDAILDGGLARLVSKIEQVIPVHVRLTDIVHIIGPVRVVVPVGASGTATTTP